MSMPTRRTISRLAYLSRKLPELAHVLDDLVPTNEGSATQQYAASTLIHPLKDIIVADSSNQSTQLLASLSDVDEPEDDYYCELRNEASVVDAFVHFAVVPTLSSLELTLAKRLLTSRTRAQQKVNISSLLKHWNYEIIKRPQQKDPGNSLRKDHYITLEARGELDKNIVPPAPFDPNDTWTTAEEFKRRLLSRAAANMDSKDVSNLPKIVLLVIEAKGPGLVIQDDWSGPIIESEISYLGKQNVYRILPQLIKYSHDATCRYVVLTDYLTTLLVYVSQYPSTVLSSPAPEAKPAEISDKFIYENGTSFDEVENVAEEEDSELEETEEEDSVEDEEGEEANIENGKEDDAEGNTDKVIAQTRDTVVKPDEVAVGILNESAGANIVQDDEEYDAIIHVGGQKDEPMLMMYSVIIQRLEEIGVEFDID